MGVIQNSINQALSAAAGGALAVAHTATQANQEKNQKILAKEAERSNINSELNKLDEKEKTLNSNIEDEMTKDPIVENVLDPKTGENSAEVVTDKEKYLNNKLNDSKSRYDQVKGMMNDELTNGGMNAQYSDEYKSMSKDAIMYKRAIESYQNKLDMMRTINAARADLNNRYSKLNGGK